MGRETLPDVLAKLRAQLPRWRETYGIRTLAVFGSVARGDDTPTSDVDVLVELDKTIGLFALAHLQREMEGIVGRKVDIVMKAALRPALLQYALEDAVTV